MAQDFSFIIVYCSSTGQLRFYVSEFAIEVYYAVF